MLEKVKIPSGNVELSGNIHKPLEQKQPLGVLFLHGGGNSTKERFTLLQEYFSGIGIASLAVDFRGIGNSTGNFEDGGINNRIQDADAACDYLQGLPVDKLIVAGASMGGAVAIGLLEKRNDIGGLILISPAAYSKNAHAARLGKEFGNKIRKKDNWRKSPSFDLLKGFTGPVIIIYGEYDGVIPQGVKDMYKASLNPSGRYKEIKNGNHTLLDVKSGQTQMPQAFLEVRQEIENFLREI